MSEPLTFYMDESGFTGEDMLAASQPVFAHGSTIASDRLCKELYGEFFADVQAKELKHSRLASRSSGRDRIARFLKEVCKHHRERFAAWVVHKEFCLLTFLIDRWVEWAMYLDGYDLYKDGGAIAFSNMSFFCLRTFQSDQFLRDHLARFQVMMRERTPRSYRDFWGRMQDDFEKVDRRTQDILSMFLLSGDRLGFQHLIGLPPRSIDIAMATAVSTCNHWRKSHEGPLRLVHDRSSNLAKDKVLWDLITSLRADEMTVGIPGRDMQLPLNVEDTLFEDSKSFLQLQFCDLLAGATAYLGGKIIAETNDEYRARLEDTGIEELLIGTLWPEPKVTPAELGTRGASGEVVERLTEQLVKLDRGGTLLDRS